MALQKWQPLRELETMRREMDRIWDELFPSAGPPWRERRGTARDVAAPAVDMIDKNDEIVVKADMPGVAKDKLDISLQDNILTIKGEAEEEKEVKEEKFFYSERSRRSFERSVEIPYKVNAEKLSANLKDGVLVVHLPKAEEERPKKIKVEVS